MQSFPINPPIGKEVHLWIGNSDFFYKEQASSYLLLLPDEEKQRYLGYINETSRANYLLGRFMLRAILSHYHPDTKLDKWVFAYNQHGKPSLATENDFEFNLSHSGNLVTALFTRNMACGVDVEKKESISDCVGIAKRFFHELEYEQIDNNPDREAAFASLWSLKEAYSKAIGMGLAKDFASFSVIDRSGCFEISDCQAGEYFLFQFKWLDYWISGCVLGSEKIHLEIFWPSQVKHLCMMHSRS
jgi:4'-phosphopantetheinyl transferase